VNGSFILSVSDGTHEHAELLQWAFGSGAIAQSYLWWEKGQLYESRFNYFADLHGFDRTPGRLAAPPVSLEMAEGRKLAEFEARECYSCHATALTTTEPLSAAHYQPGITCEACHGPGRAHVAAMDAGDDDDLEIVNPAHYSPAVSVDFCGACHSTPKDAELMGVVGPLTARFPAYRLEKSRCWGRAGDARLTCFACHNPHQPLERDAAAYDSACLRVMPTARPAAHADLRFRLPALWQSLAARPATWKKSRWPAFITTSPITTSVLSRPEFLSRIETMTESATLLSRLHGGCVPLLVLLLVFGAAGPAPAQATPSTPQPIPISSARS